MFPEVAKTLNDRRAARKNSQNERVSKAAEIANFSDEQVLVWCNLNSESAGLSAAINGNIEVKGSDTNEHKIDAILAFTAKKIKSIVSKPEIYGFGINLQNCHKIIFVGLSDSFEQYYQAVRRCWRFGQTYPVDVYIIISEAEGAVRQNIERKQKDAERMTAEMVKHTKEILKAEIAHTMRISESYIPLEDIKIPGWLRNEVA
jgi:superfamily II DNA helicase RecQ